MNSSIVRLASISALAILSQAAVSQSARSLHANNMQHVTVPMPKGLVQAEAQTIDKEWVPRIVHLKEKAKVRIYTAAQAPRGVLVLEADEVDLDQRTGEISPRGHVRLTVEDIK